MRFLDTNEKISPRFLMDPGKPRKEWPFPDIELASFNGEEGRPPVGDYFSGEQKYMGRYTVNPFIASDGKEYRTEMEELVGNLVEFKFGSDFGIHTEPLERFQDELYRMACYRQKNPHVMLHAVWIPNKTPSSHEEDIFHHNCSKYHIWAHIIRPDYDQPAYIMEQEQKDRFIEFLKKLDQPKSYQEFEPYIKKSHEEPTILAKMIRQYPLISSEMAITLASKYDCPKDWFECESFSGDDCWFDYDVHVHVWKDPIIEVIGRKKNGEPKKLALDFIRFLEDGE